MDTLLDIAPDVMDQLITIAKGAEHKEVDELDETERTAIAVLAGADIRTRTTRNGTLEIRTKHKVGITKENGVFNVVEKVRMKKLNGYAA